MTHELTHLIIHQATDNPYADIPRWLDEGLAVYNEDPNQLDEQFREGFAKAVAEDSLFTLQTLSSTFPADPEAANLAYGQSGAVTKFIVDTYGTEAMHELLQIFAEGTITDDALEEALGENTQTLTDAFRTSLALEPLYTDQEQAADSETESSQTEAEAPETEPAQSEAIEPEPQPTEDTSAEVEDSTADTQPAAESTDSNSGRRGLFGCLSGLLPLTALGFVYSQRLSARRRR
jgi:hypothetical protein